MVGFQLECTKMKIHAYNNEYGVVPLIVLFGMIMLICVVGISAYAATDRFTNFTTPSITTLLSKDNPIINPSANPANGITSPSQTTASTDVSKIPNTTTNSISVQKISNGNDLDKISQDLDNTNIDSINSQIDQLNTDSQGM